MLLRLIFALLLAGSLGSTSFAQVPPRSVPEVYCPGIDVKGPMEELHWSKDETKVAYRVDLEKLFAPYLSPTVNANATPRELVRAGIARNAADWLMRSSHTYRPQICDWRTFSPLDTAEVCSILAKADTDPVAGYEAAVLILREQERFTDARVWAGQEPPHLLHLARLLRLEAESELLHALPVYPCPRTVRRASGGLPMDLKYTAFPEVVIPMAPGMYKDNRLAPDPVALVMPFYVTSEATPTAIESSRDRIQKAIIRSCAKHLDRTFELIQVGRWDPSITPQELLSTSALAVAAVESRSAAPGERLAWREQQLRILKDQERLATARVEAGQDAPQSLSRARMQRLLGELTLLDLGNPSVKSAPLPQGNVQRHLRQGESYTAYPQLVGPRRTLPPSLAQYFPEGQQKQNVLDLKAVMTPLMTGPQPTGMYDRIQDAIVQEAAEYLRLSEELVFVGRWGSRELRNASGAWERAIAARLRRPCTNEERVKCRQASVMWWKAIEERTNARVEAGQDMPQSLDLVSAHRLAAEEQLLAAEEAAARQTFIPSNVCTPCVPARGVWRR